MKIKKLFLISVIAIALTSANNRIFAQNWLTAGNTLTTGQFIGSNSGAFPLEIRTVPAQPINFQTANTQRMTILGAGTNAGYVGILTSNPQSLLHIGDDITPNAGWRPWMQYGNFICQTSDNMYMGMKDEGGFNKKDAVISWGDDPSGFPVGPDNLRFIFTASTALGGTAGGTNGLETMRMTPTSVNGIFTGIGGDPSTNLYVGGSANPTSTLEVNSQGATSVIGGSSGLRFTNLNSTSPVIANPGLGLLSVNAQGDVIYVPGGAGTGTLTGAHNGTSLSTINPAFVAFGQNVGQAGNPGRLLSSREIPMNNFNLFFTGNSVGSNLVAIGTNTVGAGSAKFTVTNTTQPFGIAVSSNTIGMQSFGATIGVQSTANGSSAGTNKGLEATASGAAVNQGVNGSSIGGATQSIGGNFSAVGTGSTNAYGVYAVAQSGTNNYGIYAQALPASATNTAGYFAGNVIRTGTDNFTSDIKLKQNINSITNAIGIIKKLKPKTFDFKTTQYPQMGLSDRKQYGLIAQEVETILPELVSTAIQPPVVDGKGNITTPAVTYKTLNYNAFIAILMKGIQEQQGKIDSKDSIIDNLNTRLTKLENCLSGILPVLCQINNSRTQDNTAQVQHQLRTMIDVNLADENTIVLSQNVPNPFAQSTVINYSIPATVQKAEINFYNFSGQLIKSVDITGKGAGLLNVFGDDLSSGLYTYTLVADGKVVETKKMVKQ